MNAPRIVLISDTHLSRARPFFHANWELLLRELAEAPAPEFFLITGDVALDGPSREDDLAFARAEFDRLPAPWRAVPGNHDIGSNRPDLRGEHVVDEARRAAWTRHFGPDWWSLDCGAWRLVGLNSLIAGSGMAAEAEQAAFLDDAIATAGSRQVALLTHKPLCIQDMLETGRSTTCWYPETRELIARHAREGRISTIFTGHLHEARDRLIGGVRHVWLPGLAFVMDVMGEWQPQRGGRRQVGFVECTLGAELSLAWHAPHSLLNTDIGNWLRGGAIGHYATLAGEAAPYPGLNPPKG
ncbi:metallophosphoesterase [Falsiroseomonas sp.]|uniref:metallophosphoesterase family protein n=1 Tax=Falsiroseomonas sp. TaxID=2870721 RepID=UPI0034A40742